MSLERCGICGREPFKYTCPRCNIIYCSVSCYKSQQHLKCSEEFYKQCIQEELESTSKSEGYSKNDMYKIYNILKRIHEVDAGFEVNSFEQDGLDSDDNENTHEEDKYDENDELGEGENIDDDDIAERLKDIDINDADEVWERLTLAEKEEFKKLVSSGEIMKLMPDFKPWWFANKNSKIVEISCINEQQQNNVPSIFENILEYSSICSKEPATCLHYNLWNILGAYSCTVRFFNGEHPQNSSEATAFLINLCLTLKCGTNFEEVKDAIISVEMEALTTGSGVSQLMATTSAPGTLLVENRTQLYADARQLMSTVHNKLSALSDILRLLQLAKNNLKAPNKGEAEFQKLFALSSGMEELTCSKIKKLIKKIQFYISYVNRELDNGLN